MNVLMKLSTHPPCYLRFSLQSLAFNSVKPWVMLLILIKVKITKKKEKKKREGDKLNYKNDDIFENMN